MAEIEHALWSRQESARAGTSLVVALHGRGADEHGMAGLADHLPGAITLASVRAPIAEGGGYAWFGNRGIGRPVESSIKDVAASLFAWLDEVAKQHRNVVLLGFSGGTAMAGALLFEQPDRFAGAVLLSGTLPWDAGLNSSRGRLDGFRIFWANDTDDPVIPRDLVDRSEAWLRTESGAALVERHYPGLGHGINAEEMRDVHHFVAGFVAGEPTNG
jgi:phospholipase/carboxylesterase